MPTPSKLTVDFTNVGDRQEGGKAAHVPEGDYLLKVKGVTLETKKGDESSKYLRWRFTIHKPSGYENAGVIYHNTTLQADKLWSLRNVLEDLGINVPKKAVGLPLAEIGKSGRILGATLEDDEYNGKVKSQIAATFKKEQYEETAKPVDESGDDTDTDEDTASDTSDDEEETEELDIDDL